MIYRIPVSKDLVRTIKDPSLPDSRILHAYVRISDLPQNISWRPDPRQPKEKSPVVTRIAKSALSNDGRFHLLNRGITISARDYSYDGEREVLTLDLGDANDDGEVYGIIDGGHTYRTISELASGRRQAQTGAHEGPFVDDQFVHLEILIRVQQHLADIAEARNFSVSLKAWTLAGYKDKFDWFLEALGPQNRRHVKISENDPEPVGILDLIQLMCAVNPGLFKDGTPATEAYKNAGKCLEYFIADGDPYGFRRLAPVAADVVRLFDYIREGWKRAYGEKDESGRKGRLGARREAKLRKRNRAALVTYYFLNPNEPQKGGEEDFPVEKGFAIPAIASLRPLLVGTADGNLGWYTDPFRFWDNHGPKIVKAIMQASEASGFNPHVVGRDPQVYSNLYTLVRSTLLEEFYAQRGEQLPF